MPTYRYVSPPEPKLRSQRFNFYFLTPKSPPTGLKLLSET